MAVASGHTWGAQNATPTASHPWGKKWFYEGTLNVARYNTNWGQLLVASGDAFVSSIIDFGDSNSRLLTITTDDYNTGGGKGGTVYWRGRNSDFTPDANPANPNLNWVLYNQTATTNRYIQLKVTGSA